MLINQYIRGKTQYILPHSDTCRIRLAIIENQFPLPQSVIASYHSAYTPYHDINLYPMMDDTYHDLMNRLGQYLEIDMPAQRIVLTNGSDNALKLLLEAFATPQSSILLPIPTYPHFEQFLSCMYVGMVVQVPISIDDTSEMVVDKILAHPPHNLIYLCSPNLPYGYTLSNSDVMRLCSHRPNTAIIIDEAYYEYSALGTNPISSVGLIDVCPNLIIVRTFSKFFGLAGIRLGYLCANVDLIKTLRVLSNEKNVTMSAVCTGGAAMMALDEYKTIHMEATKVRMWVNNRLALMIYQSAEIYDYKINAGNWFLLFARDPAMVTSIFSDNSVLIRNKSSDHPGMLRVTFGRMDQMEHVMRIVMMINLPAILRMWPTWTPIIDFDNTLRPGSKNCKPLYPGIASILTSLPHYIICSNNATYTPKMIADYLHGEGVSIEEGQIHTPLSAARVIFRQCGYKSILIVGNSDTRGYLGEFWNGPPYDACALMCCHYVDAEMMQDICRLGAEGKPIYYGDTGLVVPMVDCADVDDNSDTPLPEIGAYAEMLKTCGYNCILIGKPSPLILCGLDVSNPIIIGDSIKSDGGLASSINAPFIHIDPTQQSSFVADDRIVLMKIE